MRNFRKLIAWQKADDLAVKIYEVTGRFPTDGIWHHITGETGRCVRSC